MESLRVMPPIPLTSRKATEADYLDGVYIPKGTVLIIPINNLSMNKDVWGEDAEVYVLE